jgi:hypothetical protein
LDRFGDNAVVQQVAAFIRGDSKRGLVIPKSEHDG